MSVKLCSQELDHFLKIIEPLTAMCDHPTLSAPKYKPRPSFAPRILNHIPASFQILVVVPLRLVPPRPQNQSRGRQRHGRLELPRSDPWRRQGRRRAFIGEELGAHRPPGHREGLRIPGSITFEQRIKPAIKFLKYFFKMALLSYMYVWNILFNGICRLKIVFNECVFQLIINLHPVDLYLGCI